MEIFIYAVEDEIFHIIVRVWNDQAHKEDVFEVHMKEKNVHFSSLKIY